MSNQPKLNNYSVENRTLGKGAYAKVKCKSQPSSRNV